MARTYTAPAATPGGPAITWQDRKRWAWSLSVVYPLMPVLDALIGEDLNNPPEAVVPALEADRYYRWLTWATVPLHFVALIACAVWVGAHNLPWWGVLLAYVPPLWFAVMDKRPLALPQVQGDLARVNVCPRRRQALLRRYGQAGSASASA